MVDVQIVYATHGGITRHADPNEQFDGDDEQYFHNMHAFDIVGEDQYRDLSVPFEPEPNKPYFLVYVLYGTGDSFSSQRGMLQFIDLYDTEKKAKEMKRILEKQLDSREGPYEEDPYELEVKNSEGIKYNISNPCYGYFEVLEGIEIAEIGLRFDRRRK